MLYLIGQILVFLVLAAAVGVVTGWLVWGRGGALPAEAGDALPETDHTAQVATLQSRVAQLEGELSEARAQIAEQDLTVHQLRDRVLDLQTHSEPDGAPLIDADHDLPWIHNRFGGPDDLEAIWGVGPQIREILHSLGITTYRQLAMLDERGTDLLAQRLGEFGDRIRRDGWVGQARRLHRDQYGADPV